MPLSRHDPCPHLPQAELLVVASICSLGVKITVLGLLITYLGDQVGRSKWDSGQRNFAVHAGQAGDEGVGGCGISPLPF